MFRSDELIRLTTEERKSIIVYLRFTGVSVSNYVSTKFIHYPRNRHFSIDDNVLCICSCISEYHTVQTLKLMAAYFHDRE